jgi:hypothetical protein
MYLLRLTLNTVHLAHTVYSCKPMSYDSQNKERFFSLNISNWQAFILSEVGTEYINTIQMYIGVHSVNVDTQFRSFSCIWIVRISTEQFWTWIQRVRYPPSFPEENLGHQFRNQFCEVPWMTLLEASPSLHPIVFPSSPLWPMSTTLNLLSLAKVSRGITTNIRVNRVATRLEGNEGNYAGRGRITARGRFLSCLFNDAVSIETKQRLIIGWLTDVE